MSCLRRLTCFLMIGGSAALLGAGCGSSDEDQPSGMTPTDLCNEVAKTECTRLYDCTTEADRAEFGLTVPYVGCVLGLAQTLKCEMATADKICAGSQSYTADSANKCMTEANAAACTVIKANRLNFNVYAPSCSQCVPAM